MNSYPDNELELEILQHIRQSPDSVRQRDLATVIGKSLGMTNAILHRLTEKGMLTVSKVNNRNISYAVTPRGMRELAGRSYRYFKRTIKNVVDYKEAIEAELRDCLLEMAAANAGDRPRSLVLVGKSDLDFILEHLAWKYHLAWVPHDERGDPGSLPHGAGVILVWSEEREPEAGIAPDTAQISMRSFILN
jgi:predicted transcriptional regulator